MAKLQRIGRIRQLHTIISREIIKPSSSTPPHLKTHNLSLLDQFAPNIWMPVVFFYRNYKSGDANILKQSLSHCLSQYYTFSGRFPIPPASYIDCNDEGVEFLEASIDNRLDDLIHKKEQDETLDQLFPNGLGCLLPKSSPNLLEVQLNHLACGGAALAISISHKVADGCTIANFINHWAIVTRCGYHGPISTISPYFISSSTSNNIKMPECEMKPTNNYVTRRFVFPNSKLNELKNKVIAMATELAPTTMNPTRVELLMSLLFKCEVSAAKTKSSSLKTSNLLFATNVRNKTIKKYPDTTVGNMFTVVIVKMEDSSEIRLNEVIAELKKGKMELEGLRDAQEVGEKLANTLSTSNGDLSQAYSCSSVCRLPFYKADFGWGNPAKVTIRYPSMEGSCQILMDTPSGDGIEALVHLPEEEMAIFEKDEEFLAYVEKV